MDALATPPRRIRRPAASRPAGLGGRPDLSLIGVIGCGRLGSSLALGLSAAGLPVCGLADRTLAGAKRLARRVPGATALPASALIERCGLVILAVPDDAIEPLCAALAWRPGQAVVSCSGALPLSVLDAAAKRGALRGCLHPLQSFPEPSGSPERLRGIHCGVEADPALRARLLRVVRALGATPLSLRGVDRARYHLAAVFASNYVIALHAAAEQAFALAGLKPADARRALSPLTLGAAHALAAQPLERALTGPLARGDRRTLQRHLDALGAAPELRALYARLGLQLLARPLGLPARTRRELTRLLTAAASSETSDR